MTREEAIAELSYIADEMPSMECADWKEAICIAIKALEQEPCEDCISRQAVIDGINEYFHDEYYQRTSIQDCRDCLIEDVIKSLPSVTPQHSDAEIQKIQEMEQAEIQKAYELGKAEMQPCGDAISRQAAIEALTKTSGIRGDALKALYYLPSVSPDRRTGRWRAQDIHNCHTNFKCSECGYIHSFMHLYGKPTADYTYCPKCGAKMVEPQESEVQDADND